MKRILLLTLLALLVLAAGAYALVQIEQPGYVLVAYKSFRYESSLWGALVLLASLWLLLFSLRLLFRLLTASGRVVNPWSRRNRTRRVQLSAEQGLLDLTEGRWERALRHLRRAAEGDAQPLMHYPRCRPRRPGAGPLRGKRQFAGASLAPSAAGGTGDCPGPC
jgi:HemY protein